MILKNDKGLRIFMPFFYFIEHFKYFLVLFRLLGHLKRWSYISFSVRTLVCKLKLNLFT